MVVLARVGHHAGRSGPGQPPADGARASHGNDIPRRGCHLAVDTSVR